MISMSNRNPFRMPVSPLQLLLLIQLENGSKYGYEMLKNLKDEFDGVWEPKTGTVYPALKSLEKKGFVEIKDTEKKDYYFITEDGRKLFEQMIHYVNESTKFSAKYMTVVFKWMSKNMKIGFLDFISNTSTGKYLMSAPILNQIHENLDEDIKEHFLKNLRLIIKNRLDVVDALLKSREEDKK
jgi:DNA-binding PadR family transcriptional regulator